MPEGFTPAPVTTALAPMPFSAGPQLVPTFDAIDLLPEGAGDRLRALRDHVHSLHLLTVPHADLREATNARVQAEQRLARLQKHPQEFGFNLPPGDPRCVEAQRLLDKAGGDLRRLTERSDARAKAWTAAAQTLAAVERWIKDGKPANTALKVMRIAAPKPVKGENGLLDQIENRRRRVRELKAAIHTLETSCYPSAYCKQRMREQLETLAASGAPVVSELVAHGREIGWPTQTLRSNIFNAKDPLVAFAEAHDVLPLVAWLFKPALIAALDREIDAKSDDANALTPEAREQRSAELMGDLLAVERVEASIVWAALADGLPVFHRHDCSVAAILEVELVVTPRAAPPDTSPEHSYDVVHGGRRQ